MIAGSERQRIDGSALRFIVCGRQEQPRAIVLLLHGSGSYGGNLLDVAEHWAKKLPDILFVMPDAPLSYREVLPPDAIAATERARPGLNWEESRTWVDTSVEIAGTPEEQTRALLDLLRPPIRALSRFIDLLLAKHGLSDAALAVYGFSQGGMMAAYLGLERANACAGVICHSGQFYGVGDVRSRPRTLVIVGSKELDPRHPQHELYPFTLRKLRQLGVEVEELVADGLLHGVNQQVADRCTAFFTAALSQPAAARVE